MGQMHHSAIGGVLLGLSPWYTQTTPAKTTPISHTGAEERHRRPGQWTAAAILEVVAGCFSAASIPIALFALKWLVDARLGHSVSWDQFWWALNYTGLTEVLAVGVVAQAVLAGAAFVVGEARLPPGSPGWTAPIVAGAIGVIVSLSVFGGLVGAAAGFLSLVAGVTGLGPPRLYEPEPTDLRSPSGQLPPTLPPPRP